MAMVFFVNCIIDQKPQISRILGAVAVFLIYIKAFYFFKLFSPTASFMRTIT